MENARIIEKNLTRGIAPHIGCRIKSATVFVEKRKVRREILS